jgi:hypothetical protein
VQSQIDVYTNDEVLETYDELLSELKECLGLPVLAIEAENQVDIINIDDL